MKKVLIVTPNWPPVTYPDMHRVRTALPYLAENGWEALVLHTDPDEQGGARDSHLADTIPPGTPVFQARAVARHWTAAFGLTHVGWRSLPFLYRLGNHIIQREKPDLVFFSTTMFPVMVLGPLWAKKHGVPYVLDFQDPWVSEIGGNDEWGIKAKLSRALDRQLEPYVLRTVSHVISVSPAYGEMLLRRYPHLQPNQSTTLPFGAPELDFEYLRQHPLEQSIFRASDGRRHWVYAGRGGKDMALALRAFFLALARARRLDPQWNNLKVHFIGTSYASSGQAVGMVAPLAEACGVGDLVEERTGQVGYFESLRCLMDAEALIVPGSEDPMYTASKIYPYSLARKPLLAIFHEQSSVCQVLRETRAGELVRFVSEESPEWVSERIVAQWFQQKTLPAPSTDWKAFQRYTAHEMTRRLCGVFERVLAERETA